MTSATTEVGGVDARAKSVGQFWHEFDTVTKQVRVGIRVIDGYAPRKTVDITRWASASPKTLQNVRFYSSKNRNPFCVLCDHVRTSVASQNQGVLRRHNIRPLVRSVVDDAAHYHATKPFADVTLVEPGSLRDLPRSGWRHLQHRFDEARFVANAHEDCKRTAVQGGK
jgi:hypothetical protein